MSTTPISRVWLITGTSRGFGRALAEAVLQHGDRLVATARRPEQLDDLVARYGERVRAVALDVTSAEQARAAVAAAMKAFGRLDVVANVAGYRYLAAVEDASEADLRAELETDLWGVIHVTRAALPVLHQQRSGHIVQFSSVLGRSGMAGMSAYTMAKAAVDGFSEVLAQEVTPLGIKVTIVEPGSLRTSEAGEAKEASPSADYQSTVGQMLSRLHGQLAGHEPGDPAKMAQAILAIVNEEQPPLRLLLGREAVQLARQVDQADLAEIARWEHLSVSTDYADITRQTEDEQTSQALPTAP